MSLTRHGLGLFLPLFLEVVYKLQIIHLTYMKSLGVAHLFSDCFQGILCVLRSSIVSILSGVLWILNSVLTPLSWSAAEVKWSPCSKHPSLPWRDSWGLGCCYGYQSLCCAVLPQTAHLRHKLPIQTRNNNLQISKLFLTHCCCSCSPMTVSLFLSLDLFACHCACFAFMRLQLLIAHILNQSHKNGKSFLED